jgi:metal-responsive CopG/Arc/MetJ family transcriptional regulator
MERERINVRVDGRMKQELEAEAREKGVKPSEIVRQALEEHMQRRTPRESCYDIAKRLGIIGSAKGLPADLSTNPKHMEGFGRD